METLDEDFNYEKIIAWKILTLASASICFAQEMMTHDDSKIEMKSEMKPTSDDKMSKLDGLQIWWLSEVYILHDALEGWTLGETDEQIAIVRRIIRNIKKSVWNPLKIF